MASPPETEPLVAPPQPASAAVLSVLKQAHRNWVTAGGTSIYGPVPVPPANTVAPVVTGTAGVGNPLTCTTGTWNGAPTAYAYQWKRDTTNTGTNSSTYTTVAGDSTHAIGCVVSALNMWGTTAAKLSNTIAIP